MEEMNEDAGLERQAWGSADGAGAVVLVREHPYPIPLGRAGLSELAGRSDRGRSYGSMMW